MNDVISVDQASEQTERVDRPPAGAKLDRAEVDDLEWFFGVAPTRFAHSTGVPSDAMSPFEIMKAGFEYGTPSNEKVYSSQPGADGKHYVIGNRSGLTARVTAEYRNIGGIEPDRVTIRRFGRISSNVLAVAKGDGTHEGRTFGEMHVSVLKTYFGDEGNVWEQLSIAGGAFEVVRDEESGRAQLDEKGQLLVREKRSPHSGHRTHGRIGAVYALTRGGQLLLRYSEKLAKKKGQPFYDFGDQVRLQLEVRGKMNVEQRSLLARAQREARALFVSASFAWNRVRAREMKERGE